MYEYINHELADITLSADMSDWKYVNCFHTAY